jgi:CBS domain-containing protein
MAPPLQESSGTEENTMLVQSLMSPEPSYCHSSEALHVAARILCETHGGLVPVLDEHRRVTGVVTDHDVCVAAYKHGRPLWTIPIPSAMSGTVVTCHADDDVATAERIMRDARVRRLPVVDLDGKLVGMIALDDLARGVVDARRGDAAKVGDLAATLAVIGLPKAPGRTLPDAV